MPALEPLLERLSSERDRFLLRCLEDFLVFAAPDSSLDFELLFSLRDLGVDPPLELDAFTFYVTLLALLKAADEELEDPPEDADEPLSLSLSSEPPLPISSS